MKIRTLAAAFGALAIALLAQRGGPRVPPSPAEVARPGGKLPGGPKIALVKVADGFVDPTNVANAGDGSGRIFVTERVGRVRIIHKDGTVQKEPFLDLTNFNPLGSDVQTGFVEQGLYSIAFHPKFKQNGYFFVHYASLPFNGDGLIVRIQVDPKSPNAVTADRIKQTAKVIMRIEQPYYNHNGGQIEFGKDGYLYIASGDGGWEGDPLETGQDLSTWLGKILRIDVDTTDGRPYRIPPTNPFATANAERLMSLFGITEEEFNKIKMKGKSEIWAYGVRNPYEFSFDLKTGDLFIADVGQNHWEEIIYQPASSKGGENYGWPKVNGTKCFPMTGPDDKCALVGVMPAAEYPHEIPYPGAKPLKDGWGCSIEGLGVANYGGMNGVYLVGDWCSGRVFGLGWDGQRWQLEEMLQTNLQFTAGGYDEQGNVLAVNCNCFYTSDRGAMGNPPGALWRVVPASQVPSGAETARVIPKGLHTSAASSGPLTFRHPLDNTALDFNSAPDAGLTATVRQFRDSGRNPLNGNAQAVTAGKALYQQNCAGCHLEDAKGRIGSNLVDSQYNHPRVANDVGMFEVIYAGGTGAMQPYAGRLKHEEILQVMAFLSSLPKSR
jgi:cytochrome c(L)